MSDSVRLKTSNILFQGIYCSKYLDNLEVKVFASLTPKLIQGYADMCLDIKIKAYVLLVSDRGWAF